MGDQVTTEEDVAFAFAVDIAFYNGKRQFEPRAQSAVVYGFDEVVFVKGIFIGYLAQFLLCGFIPRYAIILVGKKACDQQNGK